MEGGAPCGACKFLRRKCVKGCVFSPYFSTEEFGAAHFGAIHKIFGASNFSKLLQRIPSEEERHDAVVSISYEAQARIHDPIYGCVSHVFALQHQVARLQAELIIANEQLARSAGRIVLKERQMTSASSKATPSNEPHFSYPNAANKISFYPNIAVNRNSCVPMTVNSCEDLHSASKQVGALEEERNSTEVARLQAELIIANEQLARSPGRIVLKEDQMTSASSKATPSNEPHFSYPNAANKISFYPNIAVDRNSCVPMNVNSCEDLHSASKQVGALEEERNSTEVARLQAGLIIANEQLARSPGRIVLKEGQMTSASSKATPSNEPHFSYPNAANKISFYPNIAVDRNSCVPMNVNSCEDLHSASKQVGALEEERNSTEVSPEQEGDLHALAFSFLKRSRR